MTGIRAVVFDWAGTMTDFGSRAPMGVFVETFASFGVAISVADARGPMGLPKLEHIRALGALEHVQAQWRERHGGPFDEAAAQAVYARFVPKNVEVVTDYADLVPGAAGTVRALRERGIAIGSTTGYTRDIMERLLPAAAAQGYAPDNLVCAGDLFAGRPTAVMMWKCFLDLEVADPATCVKVDDTGVGLAEGRAAGTWTVGVSLSGNEVGLSPEEVAALSAEDRAAAVARAARALTAAGADYVIDSVADLMPVIDAIERRLAAGERPAA